MVQTLAQRAALVRQWRSQPLIGSTIAMTPCTPDDAADLVRLRNAERARFGLNQLQHLTVEAQADFLRTYLARSNDLYWMIRTRDGAVVGANALYSIDDVPGVAEKGRLVIDEALGLAGPFALESDLLLLDLAFKSLELDRVVTIVRPENTKMLSMNSRLGFKPCGEREVRGVMYGEFCLESTHFEAEPLQSIVAHWRDRFERTPAQGSVFKSAGDPH
jgi:RimJ/RimL family protein N-acetyltransferase